VTKERDEAWAKLDSRADSDEKETRELRAALAWVESIAVQASCGFCAPSPTLKPEEIARMQEHMSTCEKHPLFTARADLQVAREALEKLSNNDSCPCLQCQAVKAKARTTLTKQVTKPETIRNMTPFPSDSRCTQGHVTQQALVLDANSSRDGELVLNPTYCVECYRAWRLQTFPLSSEPVGVPPIDIPSLMRGGLEYEDGLKDGAAERDALCAALQVARKALEVALEDCARMARRWNYDCETSCNFCSDDEPKSDPLALFEHAKDCLALKHARAALRALSKEKP
jgi:hypothetical protein